MTRTRRLAVAVAVALAAEPGGGAAADTGQIVDDLELTTLDGRTEPLVDRASGATVVVFFRTEQERSVEALRGVRECEPALAGKRTRIVGVVSDQAPPAEVRATLAASGAKLPVLVDAGDALYGRIGVRTHPTLAILDKARRVVAVDSYHRVGTCEVLRARVRRVLGEISDAELEAALAPADSQLPGEAPLDVAARHVKFGRKLLAQKSYAEAHRNARKSLELGPSAAAWALEGEIFAAEGRCADANRAFDAALKLDPKDGVARGRAGCAMTGP